MDKMTEEQLLGRIRLTTAVFIVGLALSGITAIPLISETSFLMCLFGWDVSTETQPGKWLVRINQALTDTLQTQPQLLYGYDWLAFGHIVIATAFIGALKDPVKNKWLFDFGLIACALVIPWAMIFGALREIPFWWRVIDCSFGFFGAIPLWLSRGWVQQLEESS